jgi:pyridoxal phosphate enzyme (YggS family)
MPGVSERIRTILSELPERVRLVAVSKTHPVEMILEAYEAGQRIFGENRVQELISKQPYLPEDIQWHLIGHLQTNKVKYIAPFISMIHSVDSLKLLAEISKEGIKCGRKIDCLLQIHIAEEETKFGLDKKELFELLDHLNHSPLPGVRIRGLMGMATFTDDMDQVAREFAGIQSLFAETRTKYFSGNDDFSELSIGMSGDYKIAVKFGSTLVRIGTAIFGVR